MRVQSLFFCLILLINSFSNNAQWVQQNSGTTNDLNEVHFPVPDTGYVVGWESTFLKTTDGGITWDSLNVGILIIITSVYFTDANTGYITGTYGTILKTIDGGFNWNTQFSDSSLEFLSVYFIDSVIGFAAGVNNQSERPVVLKTVDGGKNWSTSTIINDSTITALKVIHFPVPDTGYALYTHGILKSIDGGDSWYLLINKASPDFIDGNSFLEACYFTDANIGYIGGWYNSSLYRTTDGGTKWTNLDSTYTLNPSVRSIHFPSSDIGYAVGWSKNIFKTSDAGNTWIKQNYSLINGKRLYSVYFINDNIGYAVGEKGVVLKTTNGGSTFIDDRNYDKDVLQTYPNPFSYSTIIQIPTPFTNKSVSLSVYDLLGKEVKRIDNITSATFTLYREDLKSGLYIYKLIGNEGLINTGKLAISY